MRQLHRFHEFLLEVLLHRQFDVFHVPGTPVGLHPLLHIQQCSTATVAGGIADTFDLFNFAVRKQTHGQRLLPVHVGTERSGDLNRVHLLKTHPLDHQLAACIQRALGQLDLTYILLGDHDVLVDARLLRPGQHKFRHIRVRILAKTRMVFQCLLIEDTTFGDNAGAVQLGKHVQNTRTADPLDLHFLWF